MSSVVILKLPNTPAAEASEIATRLLKKALAPFAGEVEVFTFEQNTFEAHWRPLHEPPQKRVFEPEHSATTTRRR